MNLSRRARQSLALTLLALVVLALPVLDQILFRYNWAAEAMEELEFRYARLLGLREAAPRIDAALTRAQGYLQRHAYPADYPIDRVGAELQQRVRGLAGDAGIAVSGSQILPVISSEAYEIVPLTVTLNASPAALRDLLVVLAAQSPSIQVDGYAINNLRARRGAPESSDARVQLRLSAIHLKP